jgi:SpoVK/Ycf46/Vps4 family AAA+-type ATPase
VTTRAETHRLQAALRQLDALLERAVAAAQTLHAHGDVLSAYRGLYITDDEVERLLAREPGEPTLWAGEGEEAEEPPLPWLRDAYGLDGFELDVVLIALAPELDLRYERMFAYLNDDVTRRRPTVELALNMLCRDAEEKLERRAHFAPEAPLLRHRVLHVLPDPGQLQPPLLAHALKLDEQLVAALTGASGLDHRLAWCELVRAALPLEELPIDERTRRDARTLIGDARTERRPLRLLFSGPPDTVKRLAAGALAVESGSWLLDADLARLPSSDLSFEQLVELLVREAWLHDAVLFVDGVDGLRGDGRYDVLLDGVVRSQGIVILAASQALPPAAPGRGPVGLVELSFPLPGHRLRSELWRRALAPAGSRADADHLAARFRLTPDRIADAALTAGAEARVRGDVQPTIADLAAAARAQSGHELAALTAKLDPLTTWDDLVLPDDALAQLHEICQRVAGTETVLDAWGFGRKLALGKGANALFAGPSGTGKTMSAGIIANELGLDLYKIDLAGVVSKYIGETEKNLDRIFSAAEDANAILFFDEADALFGKRSEVRDSHDRYANIEIAYLLQKMEAFAGVAILASNLHTNLDEAFVRRLAFVVYFPFPDEKERARIWRLVWPAATPLADDVDFDVLAERFLLSGGNIKNIALAAAFLAAEEGEPITMRHLLHATRREYQKLGKDLPAEPVAEEVEGAVEAA